MTEDKIKAKVKSFDEIEKTLEPNSIFAKQGGCFPENMRLLCGTIVTVEPLYGGFYDYCLCAPPGWAFRKEWLEIDGELSEQDYPTINELDEMLKYFLGQRILK
jgi:hypothetical protein